MVRINFKWNYLHIYNQEFIFIYKLTSEVKNPNTVALTLKKSTCKS